MMSRMLIVGRVLMAAVFCGCADENQVARFNYAVGTQTIGSKYQFTEKTRLVETAEVILGMGSNILKFRMDSRFADDNYAGSRPVKPRALVDLAKRDSSIRTVLEMPFYYYFMWVTPVQPAAWRDENGYTDRDAEVEYREMYDLSCYLLKTYSDSGKTFYLGYWEGDWLLQGTYNASDRPDPKHIQSMIKWLNNRQRAVEDAKRDTPHGDVNIFHYTEVNLVEKGLRGQPCVTTEVLPHTTVDFVSYSAYEVELDHNLPKALERTLDFIQKKIPRKEGLDGPRVFIGEFGYRGSAFGPEGQKVESLKFAKAALEWGCPFVLCWQLYDNELVDGKYNGFWLIDNHGKKQPFFQALENYFSDARLYVQEQIEEKRSVPNRQKFNRRAREILNDVGRKN